LPPQKGLAASWLKKCIASCSGIELPQISPITAD
jgi:hypothetical protein